LIDEIDVFCGEAFYGRTFNPSTEVASEQISALVDFIWKNRVGLVVENVVSSAEFSAVVRTMRPEIARRIVEKLVSALSTYHLAPFSKYKMIGERIGYPKPDGSYSVNTSYGPYTLWNYYAERDRGIKVRFDKSVTINCGKFSFAELPKGYNFILGVSGTLTSLSKLESSLLQKYEIARLTIMPSIFGIKKKSFDEATNTSIYSTKAQWHEAIDSKIKAAKSQPVLIFFENAACLTEYAESEIGKRYKPFLLTPGIDAPGMNQIMSVATMTSSVTLATRDFGRGLDFVCHDNAVEKNGGMWVVQTFLSTAKSEEIQIMGRTARQQKSGQYFLVVNAEDTKNVFNSYAKFNNSLVCR
jgi:hypothetical protein